MPATPQVTVTGTIKTLAGVTDPGYVIFTLTNVTFDNIPRVSGTSVIPQQVICATANSAGFFSVTLYGNDQISPANTAYTFQVISSFGPPSPLSLYQFFGTETVDISTLTPLSPQSPNPPFGLAELGLSTNAPWFTVGNSPLTNSGSGGIISLDLTGGLPANEFLATPNGTSGEVSLRPLAFADLPVFGTTSIPRIIASGTPLTAGNFSLLGWGTTNPVRGSGIQTSIGESFSIAFPSGTIAGDLAIIFGATAYDATVPDGWNATYQDTDTVWDSLCISKVLNSTDISAGSVTIVTASSYNAVFSIITCIGAPTIREIHGASAQASNPYSLTSSSSVQSMDFAISFGSMRTSGTPRTITPTLGTQIQFIDDGTEAMGQLSTYLPPSNGAITQTWLYGTGSSSPSGFDSQMLLILESDGETGGTISAIAGSDSAHTFTITTGHAPETEPSVKLTFADGTWGEPPIVLCNMVNGTGNFAFVEVATTATSYTLTLVASPGANSSYTFNAHVVGVTN